MNDKLKSSRRKNKKGRPNKDMPTAGETKVTVVAATDKCNSADNSHISPNQLVKGHVVMESSPVNKVEPLTGVNVSNVSRDEIKSQLQTKSIGVAKANSDKSPHEKFPAEQINRNSNVQRTEKTPRDPVAAVPHLKTEANVIKESAVPVVSQAPNSLPSSNKLLPENGADGKSKAELKAERRALFEAQRAVKAVQKPNEKVPNTEGKASKSDLSKQSSEEKSFDSKKKPDTDKEQSSDVSKLKTSGVLVSDSLNEINKAVVPNEQSVNGTLPNDTAPSKSKAEQRAERRALQEAQRAAKSGKKDEKKTVPESSKDVPSKSVKVAIDLKLTTKPASQLIVKKPATALKQVKLVSHLPQYKQQISVVKAAENGVHPAIVKLGLQYASGIICGSNSRCVNFIKVLAKVIQDFKMPENKDFSVAIYSLCIEPAVEFLEKCRPISVGMKNVCKMLREEISHIPKDVSDDEVRQTLVKALESFLENHIFKAHDSIVNLAIDKITSKDVIVTYGCSYIVKRVLKAAHENLVSLNEKFRVIVVDGRPKLEGRNMLRYLVNNGIECTYVQINALAHVMREATKVFLGAHALLANGCVMSRVGSSQVALVAKAFNKPVLVCCETYKFCDMVQTDSFVINELGNPEDLVEIKSRNNPLSEWKAANTLNILNLYYDVTPPDLVTVLINEGYVVPCTSVPVVLRVRPKKT